MRDGDVINLERRLGTVMMEGGYHAKDLQKDIPRPSTVAKEWSPLPSSAIPMFVRQYIPKWKNQYPWVMILDASGDKLTDQPGAGGCKAIHPCPGSQRSRLGHVERHVHIPAWLEPYIKLISQMPNVRTGRESNKTSLSFYSADSQYKDLDISIAHDLTRCQLLQVLFLHGTIIHNILSIDWDLQFSDKGAPSHRTSSRATATDPPVKTTWPEGQVNSMWKTLVSLLNKSHTLDNPGTKEEEDFAKAYPNSVFSNGAFGPENDWPLDFHEMGYDMIFYMLTNDTDKHSILAHQLVIPKGLNSAVCEHTLRTRFQKTGSQVKGGYLDRSKQQEGCHQIDKLVYLLLSLLRFEANRHDFKSMSTPLPLPSVK